jgi:PAS domain S-box-containing protein
MKWTLPLRRMAETGWCRTVPARFNVFVLASGATGALGAQTGTPAPPILLTAPAPQLAVLEGRALAFFLPAALLLATIVVVVLWQRRLLHQLARQRRQLAENEERLRHVLEGSDDGFWVWDLASNRIERSERWASMLGYTLSELEPSPNAAASLVHPDDLPAYLGWRDQLNSLDAGRIVVEYRMRAKTGEWRWILDRGKVVARAADGQPLRMAGTHTDITDRKLTEAALTESQALLKRSAQLLEQTQSAAHIGGWETDLRTGRVYWTQETYRLHETTPEEYYPTRETLYQFYVPESRVRLLAAAERAIRDGTPYTLELELITAKKRRISVHSTGRPEMEAGRVVKLYGAFRDITTEKNAEREREKLRLKMLEAQKLESLGVLAGGIAHDFNNLLTVVLANASFIRGDIGAHDERVAHIETAARRAADLCRQMLAYAGKGSFTMERVELGALVKDTTELIRVSISKKAHVILDLAPQLPLVDGDVSQLRQVVMNLVINASESLGDGAGEIRVATRIGQPAPAGVTQAFELPPGDCVCLEISDTGSGMSAATLARIFDPFFTTKFTGRGLGLAAVLGIVRSHRGALTVDSAPGQGSTFRLFLPPATATKAPPPAEPAAPATCGSGTILIADDEPIVLETTDALLRHFGFSTVLARDGHEAVAQFRAHRGALTTVLLDLTMPGLDGAEVARVIRAESPKLPVLVMSGFSEQDVFARIRGMGRIAILRKPFTGDMLRAQLAELAQPAPLQP